MKHVNLRLPDELHEKVKAVAEQNRRSLNSMLIVLIERALDQQDRPASPPP
jgi:predicted HicB family RNase H-like nuclease